MGQMSEILVLARLRVMATDTQLQSYRDQLQSLAPNREGLHGFSLWRSLEADGGILQVMRYPNKEAADQALQALVGSKFGPLVASITIDPPDVVLVDVKHEKGKTLEHASVGSLLSFVIRFSDPGQQAELERDAEEVLGELAFIPGFLGSFWGNNVALNEEIVSIVIWSDRESLESSIPTSHKVKLQRWQKAF